jgi:hypothetical protein
MESGVGSQITDVLVTLLESLGEPFVCELFFTIERIDSSQVLGRLRIIGFGLRSSFCLQDLCFARLHVRLVLFSGFKILQRHRVARFDCEGAFKLRNGCVILRLFILKILPVHRITEFRHSRTFLTRKRNHDKIYFYWVYKCSIQRRV